MTVQPRSITTLGGVLTLASFLAQAATEYPLGPDSQAQPGVPQGKISKFSWNQSSVFPGTTREYWVYVPAQYDASKPACLMVFQDGGGYVSTNGPYRAPIVFDNLIHKKEMPVTIGVFVNPGVVPSPSTNAQPRFNRSFEYDEPGDRYARFLLEELLPEVSKNWNITQDPAGRAITGASSGAICAFTVAWERPDSFSKVYSIVGTFVGLRGGNEYPTLIRKTEPKPIRVYLQDGSNDNNIYGGNWWVANQDMLAALELAGYDVAHAWGDGGHNGTHGGAILPDVLRWLWRDYPKPVAKPVPTKLPSHQVLIPGEEWQLVGEHYGFTEGPAANDAGEVFFTDLQNSRIHKVGLDGAVTVFAENTGGANGLMFGPDGRLYAAQNGKKRIVAYDAQGQEHVLLEGVESNDLCVGLTGGYWTDPNNKKVWHANRQREFRTVDTGIAFPNGVRFSTDQSQLFVADTRGQFVYAFQVQPNGDLAYKQPYFHLHIPVGKTDSGADGMTVDSEGRLYVATHMGVQVCDQPGRVNFIISKPQNRWLSNVAFGGAGMDTLFATCSDKVYKRKTKAKGVHSWKEPIKPPQPRL